jgi:hypothetical protein
LRELDFLLSKVKCMERQINETGLIGCASCINMPKGENVAKAAWSEQHSA